MGPAMKIQSQVNKELIELSEKNNAPSLTSKKGPSTPADKEEEEEDDDDDDGEGNTGPEDVVEANADEDESDEDVDVESETERAMNAEGGEEEEEEGGEDSDDMEEDGAEEEDEQEELSTKPAKIRKKRVVASKKRPPPKKIGRGAKGIELLDPQVNDPIAGSSIRPAKIGIPERKRKVVQFAADPKVDKKRGGRTGKRAV